MYNFSTVDRTMTYWIILGRARRRKITRSQVFQSNEVSRHIRLVSVFETWVRRFWRKKKHFSFVEFAIDSIYVCLIYLFGNIIYNGFLGFRCGASIFVNY